MKRDDESLDRIYMRTNGRCHVCRKKIAWRNYGRIEKRGAWEVDHSVPRSKGGSDHMNNLFPACVPCNRSKSNMSNASVRAAAGFARSPYSASEKRAHAAIGGGIGVVLAIFTPPPVRIGAAIVLGLLGAFLGREIEAD
jgi:5-methylcytosine-specific restriction endonuclease McrA